MYFQAPNFSGRSLDQIIEENVYFDSFGYTYRALSWLDIARKRRNVCALQYAAHDVRQAVEQLLFEELVLSVGTELDRNEYEKCKGNSTKLHKIIKKLNPDYNKLAQFTQAITSVDPDIPPLVTWDHSVLMKGWGVISDYLHWAGEPAETVESDTWFNTGVQAVEDVARYIWEKATCGYTGILIPRDMQPEIHLLWERFQTGEIDCAGVRRAATLVLPILRNRIKAQQSLGGRPRKALAHVPRRLKTSVRWPRGREV